jgi:hypothetical protein
MAYCTTAAVTQQIPSVSLDTLGNITAQTVALTAAVSAATSEVDALCRRTFEPPAQAETRRFDGTGGLLQRVTDLVRLDAVVVDGAISGFAVAYPLDGPPYLWIATGARIPPGTANVVVTGLWGYATAVPDDVSRAAASLAAVEILGRLQADRSGGVRMQVTGLAREEFPDGGPYGETIAALRNTAVRLLMPYRRWCV